METTKKIAITTDSSSGLSISDAEKIGVKVLPLPFCVNGETQYENVSLMHDEFYQKLKNNEEVSTSQPSVGDLMDFWADVLKEYDQIIHIPISSGLSKSYDTAKLFAKEKEFDGKVFVVDIGRVSVMMRESICQAVKMRDDGVCAEEIKKCLEETAGQFTCYLAVDSIKYLKKGGRVTPAAATIGTLLNIKPVLSLRTEQIGKFAVARNMKKAKETMIAAVKADVENCFGELVNSGELALSVAHTDSLEEAKIFAEEVKVAFPNIPVHFVDELSMVISCHTGPGVLALVASRTVK